MMEIPEAAVLARQVQDTVLLKRIIRVSAAQSPHKFAWYSGNPNTYHGALADQTPNNVAHWGGMLEVVKSSKNKTTWGQYLFLPGMSERKLNKSGAIFFHPKLTIPLDLIQSMPESRGAPG